MTKKEKITRHLRRFAIAMLVLSLFTGYTAAIVLLTLKELAPLGIGALVCAIMATKPIKNLTQNLFDDE